VAEGTRSLSGRSQKACGGLESLPLALESRALFGVGRGEEERRGWLDARSHPLWASRSRGSRRTTFPAHASRRASSSRASCATTSKRPTAAAASSARARALSISPASSLGGAADLMGTSVLSAPFTVTFRDESSWRTVKQAGSPSPGATPSSDATSRNPSLCASPSRSLNPLADGSSPSWPTEYLALHGAPAGAPGDARPAETTGACSSHRERRRWIGRRAGHPGRGTAGTRVWERVAWRG
jgi:hypothetical protein